MGVPWASPHFDDIFALSARANLVSALAHRADREPRRSRDLGNAAAADRIRFGPSAKPAAALVQRRL
jgi:hypothetical protein